MNEPFRHLEKDSSILPETEVINHSSVFPLGLSKISTLVKNPSHCFPYLCHLDWNISNI